MKFLMIGCLICSAIAHGSLEISANYFYPKRGTGRREFLMVPSGMPIPNDSRPIWSKIS
jgi:hypothetical protein